ncbi:glycerol dehydrogenase [Halopiger xanaduensis]|uniref:Glycerol dehydrogenase n=1 Tax=Halopiger xanaduensis (strain DSM 18323 / JCM 14033 / SH-6) TaxID=797210 RepID=F8DE87_HALXS|nr:glycerol dehydrogenase [Halopiger xanaduensis]AEH39369.1 Glycerol dehydrogenase [Halopiger xanaduensis SH-6]
MTTRIFRSPAAYIQGRNVLDDLGDYADPLGDAALVLGDEVVLDLVGERVETSLEAAGFDIDSVVFNGECSEKEIGRIRERHTEHDANLIVGIGGGKAIDTARATRERTGGALVSLPTVASTDAPTSSVAVIYSEDGEFVEFHVYERHPDLVVIDTEVVANAPTRFFRSGIGDALATWFEADAAFRSGATTLFGTRSTRTAQEIAKLAYTTLREHGRSAVDAVENNAVTESVEAVVEANTLLSGLGFESGGLAAAHAIHNGLTQLEATHEATHGEKVTIGTIAQLVLEGREDALVEDVAGFAASVGLPTTLAEIGLEDPSIEDLAIVAEAACAEDETIHNEPFEVTADDVRDALVGVDAVGRRLDH